MTRLILTLVVTMAAFGAKAAIELEISPQPMVLNQSAELRFVLTGSNDADPDFSALTGAFDILSQNRQTAIKWINGKRDQSTTWTISVMPKRAGRITLPTIRFGNQASPARTIEVTEQHTASGDKTPDIVLEVEVDSEAPYVQQQVIYTVRLLHRVDLSSPRLSTIDTSGDAVIKKLDDGRQFVQKREGVSYEAYEIRYAIFPQASGPLTVNPIVLTAQVVQGRRSFFDPLAHNRQARRVQSNAIELDVLPVPASFPAGATWLPAKRLRLHEQWEPDVSAATVGEPLARTVYLWADGLIAGQLPEFELSTPSGIKLYPDQAQTSDQSTADGFTAVQQQKFAVIANAAGEATFESIRLPWWNTTTDSLEYAVVEARAFGFERAASDTQPQPTKEAMPSAAAAAEKPPAGGNAETFRRLNYLLACGWALTAFAWWWVSRRHSAPTDDPQTRAAIPQGSQAVNELKSACRDNDAQAAARALLGWGSTLKPDAPPHSLAALSACLHSDALIKAVRDLERARYGQAAASAWHGDTLWQAFRSEPRRPSKSDKATSTQLAPLFKLIGE